MPGQTDYSIKSQAEQAAEYARRRGWKIVAIYNALNQSGHKLQIRSALTEIFARQGLLNDLLPLGYCMMLQARWQAVAGRILTWLRTRGF